MFTRMLQSGPQLVRHSCFCVLVLRLRHRPLLCCLRACAWCVWLVGRTVSCRQQSGKQACVSRCAGLSAQRLVMGHACCGGSLWVLSVYIGSSFVWCVRSQQSWVSSCQVSVFLAICWACVPMHSVRHGHTRARGRAGSLRGAKAQGSFRLPACGLARRCPSVPTLSHVAGT